MKKQNIVHRVQSVREKLVNLLTSIPEGQWDEVFLGKWSLKDITAHLIGWDVENKKSVQEILEGKLPSCFAFWDENWVSYNNVLVGRHKKGGKEELLSAMNKSHQAYVKELENVPEELFNKDVGLRWKGFTLTPAVNADYEAKDELLHAKQITAWLQNVR